MTNERMFYIAWRIVKFFDDIEMQSKFEPHELCMEIANLADAIDTSIFRRNGRFLEPYYTRLNEEIEQLDDTDWIEEAKELVELLDEWRTAV